MPPAPSPRENWEALVDFANEDDLDRIDKMSPEEVKAGLAAFEAEEKARTAEAPIAAAPPAPIEPPRTNVIPLRTRPRRSAWTITLVAAVAASLAAGAATMIARQDPPKPTPRSLPPEVFVEAHAKEIAELRGAAEAAEQKGDWEGCLTALDQAAPLFTRLPSGPDALRKRCMDDGVAANRTAAEASAAKKAWRDCRISIAAARAIRDDPADGLGDLRAKCDKEESAQMIMKRP